MGTTKYQRLQLDFQTAIQNHDNLEKCCAIIMENLDEQTEKYQEALNISGQFQSLLREDNIGILSSDERILNRNKIRSRLISLVNSIKPEDVSLLRRIHDRILVVACKKSPTDWEKLFPEAFFSHVHIMRYGDEPLADYTSPDVVIFDDLDCPGTGNMAQMRMLSRSMPTANLLYFGPTNENPFKESNVEEDIAIYARMSNANSKFTLHARLQELLEFRKIYGTP